MKLSKVLTVLTSVVLLAVALGCTQKPASDIGCEELMEMFKGHKFVAGLQGEVEITMVQDYKEISRSPTDLECRGYLRAKEVGWSNNPFTFTYEQLPDGTWEKTVNW